MKTSPSMPAGVVRTGYCLPPRGQRVVCVLCLVLVDGPGHVRFGEAEGVRGVSYFPKAGEVLLFSASLCIS